jgi:hypothetical protein
LPAVVPWHVLPCRAAFCGASLISSSPYPRNARAAVEYNTVANLVSECHNGNCDGTSTVGTESGLLKDFLSRVAREHCLQSLAYSPGKTALLQGDGLWLVGSRLQGSRTRLHRSCGCSVVEEQI